MRVPMFKLGELVMGNRVHQSLTKMVYRLLFGPNTYDFTRVILGPTTQRQIYNKRLLIAPYLFVYFRRALYREHIIELSVLRVSDLLPSVSSIRHRRVVYSLSAYTHHVIFRPRTRNACIKLGLNELRLFEGQSELDTGVRISERTYHRVAATVDLAIN